MMRRALLSLAVLATTTTTTRAALRRALASMPAEGSPQDEYVRHWAHEGKSRCGAPNCRWMREFGPIDVVTRSQCDRALRNLDAFDLIVDAASLATGGLRDLATVLYGLYDVEAPQVATVKPVGDLAVAPSIRARVLEDSWCHAEVYAAARSKPAFRQF